MKFKLTNTRKLVVYSLLFLVTAVNISFPLIKNREVFDIKRLAVSLSKGNRYYGRLKLWNYYAKHGQWNDAYKLEKGLDIADIKSYKLTNDPNELKKVVNTLNQKENKTPDDWMEIARINIKLGNVLAATEALDKAHRMDLIRDDITKAYFSAIQK